MMGDQELFMASGLGLEYEQRNAVDQVLQEFSEICINALMKKKKSQTDVRALYCHIISTDPQCRIISCTLP